MIIQKRYDFSDREFVKQIIENPYYQYFIGLSGYQEEAPFAPSLLVEFCKRFTDEILSEINEMNAQYNRPDAPSDGGCSGTDHDEKPHEGKTKGY